MSKVTKTTCVYLTIEVEEPTWTTNPQREWANLGAQKRDKVSRLLHASGLDGLGAVDFKVEAPTVCSFCGGEWEDWDAEGPACCDAAQTEWMEAQVKP